MLVYLKISTIQFEIPQLRLSVITMVYMSVCPLVRQSFCEKSSRKLLYEFHSNFLRMIVYVQVTTDYILEVSLPVSSVLRQSVCLMWLDFGSCAEKG